LVVEGAAGQWLGQQLPGRQELLVFDRRFPNKSWQYSTVGGTAVWATANTRAAIFDAMERRETFATTGTRLKARFFVGFGFTREDAQRRDLALIG
jgi:hypothetical protein